VRQDRDFFGFLALLCVKILFISYVSPEIPKPAPGSPTGLSKTVLHAPVWKLRILPLWDKPRYSIVNFYRQSSASPLLPSCEGERIDFPPRPGVIPLPAHFFSPFSLFPPAQFGYPLTRLVPVVLAALTWIFSPPSDGLGPFHSRLGSPPAFLTVSRARDPSFDERIGWFSLQPL